MEEIIKVIETEKQTPIEIALGIDEDGMTTARKLYEFLEMHPSSYARWFKRNISENQFAEENVDFIRLNRPVESAVNNGQITFDAKITASFAKKLSMMTKSEKGEQARQYFIAVEERMKEIAMQFQDMSPELRAVLAVDKRVTQVDNKVNVLEERFNKLESGMPVFNIDAKNIQTAVRRKGVQILGGKQSKAYNDRSVRAYVYCAIQCMLREKFHVKRYEEIKH